jgi:WD40 repeat protein
MLNIEPNILVSGGGDKKLKISDLVSQAELKSFTLDKNVTVIEPILDDDNYFAFEQNNRLLVCLKLEQEGNEEYITEEFPCLHTKHIWGIKYSREKNILLTGGCDFTIRLWNVSQKSCTGCYSEHTNNVTFFTLLNNGEFMSSSYDKQVKKWKFDDEKSIGTYTFHTNWINTIVSLKSLFGKDIMVSGGSDKKITFFDGNGNELHSLDAKSWVYRIKEFNLGNQFLFMNIDGHKTISIWSYLQK